MSAVLTAEQRSLLQPLMSATAAYFTLFYVFMCFQSFSKIYLFVAQPKKGDDGKKKSLREIKYDSKRGLGLISDRTFGNMVEQSIPCLASLWLYGLLVDVSHAASLMYFYIAVRAAYPFFYAKGPPLLFLCTGPNYLVIWYALAKATLAAVSSR